ncbi:hypothetical protein DTO006G1_349 [Penicillium roqueforti]|nr:hypothetical protein CBS147337_5448 [Penicillium roqueforti]KAI2691979.1 hypothetical protein LCP963914a_73 [Penicillium roqueforti]KAI2722266.1 hypothetical protein CBS147354_5558 [Penicillium roqueforti]KAI2765049.1 hypothetical protein DTO006G1_349 [Penicillium roqueforti]KAI3144307.1 hypothetical protein CBS147326_1311 [Penicillium roqueforti]
MATHRHHSSIEGALDFSMPLSLTPQQHKSARNLMIRLIRHYGSGKTVRKGYRPASLIQATLEYVKSLDTFMTFFLLYIYEDLLYDEGHAVDFDITHALVFFEGLSSWEPEQINKLHESLEKFAEYIVENFLLPLRVSSVKILQPMPMSLSSLQSSTQTGTWQQNCLLRDRHCCIVSRKFDRAAARKRFEENAEFCADDEGNLLKDESSDQFQYLEVAQILPYCLTTVASGETDLSDSKKSALRILDMFDPGIIHLIDGPMNALTLTLDYHRLFGEFKIYFEHTGTQYQYRIDSTERSPFLRDPLFPVTRSLSLSPYHTVDLPSPGFSISTAPLHLLWNLAALANILSGSFVIWRSWMSEKTDRHIWDILQAYDLAGG